MEAETHDAVWKPKQKFVMDGLCNTHDEYTYFPVPPPILQYIVKIRQFAIP